MRPTPKVAERRLLGGSSVAPSRTSVSSHLADALGAHLAVPERHLDREPVDHRRDPPRGVGGSIGAGELARALAFRHHRGDPLAPCVVEALPLRRTRLVVERAGPELDPEADVAVQGARLDQVPEPRARARQTPKRRVELLAEADLVGDQGLGQQLPRLSNQ